MGLLHTGNEGFGAINREDKISDFPWASGRNGYTGTLNFDANNNTQNNADYSNPMANHAIGPDIHPYAISLLPLIAI